MDITSDSHLDHHLSPAHLALIRERYGAREDAFILETLELPPELPGLPCALYGPLMGDEPVTEAEVSREARGGRAGPSRLVDRPQRVVRQLTVVGGHHEGRCVLWTAYGGPAAPREPWDPALDDSELAESEAFWAEHALAR